MRRRILAVLTACLAAAGCPRKAEIAPVPPGPVASAPAEDSSRNLSVEGRPLRCLVYGEGPDTLLVIGGIHGSEPAGAILARQLCDHLAANPELLEGRRVVVVPEANPDGLAAGRRTNAHDVDLNRNFPAGNFAPGPQSGPKSLSEPETRFLVDRIRLYHPARILTLHQPMTCVDYDGPARSLALAVSQASRLPMRKIGLKAGSLGSYAGADLQIPVITLELPKRASDLSPEGLWREFSRAVLLAVRYSPPPAGGT